MTITEDRLIEICTPDFPDITIAEIEEILLTQKKLEKIVKDVYDFRHKVEFMDIEYLEDIDVPKELNIILENQKTLGGKGK
jgi:hypothetical protein